MNCAACCLSRIGHAVDDDELGAAVADGLTNRTPRQGLQLLGLAADEDDGLGVTYVAVRGDGRRQVLEEGDERERLGRRVLVRAQHLARELEERPVRLVRQTRAPDDADRVAAVRSNNLFKFLRREPDGLLPRRGHEPAALLVADERRAQTLLVVDERVREATLDAEELAVVPVDVAVARDDAHHLAAPRADRELAAVGAERAGRSRAVQLPRPRLVPVGRVEQRPRRADLDAVAALRAVEPAAVGADDGVRAAPAGLDGVLAHPLVADARAALTEDAALRVVGDDRARGTSRARSSSAP